MPELPDVVAYLTALEPRVLGRRLVRFRLASPFVLGGAVGVAGPGFALARRLPRPAFDAAFQLPANRRIDRPLLLGAALFGIGWGLSGFCPGPAVAALSTGARPAWVFVAAMLLGTGIAVRLVFGSRRSGSPAAAPAAVTVGV